MFYDWLTIEQDFGYQLPILGDVAYQRIHIDSGETSGLNQPVFQHRGSFCDTVSISVRGSVLKMSGNPSRWDRLDNLFGLPSVDACVSVYNGILESLDLPVFTRCTMLSPRQAKENEKAGLVADGAIIRCLHVTSNRAVGQGNTDAYISALSTQPFRNSIPRLHTNGKTVDWLSKKGAANLLYPKVYEKLNEIILHLEPKIKNKFGEGSGEHNYIRQLMKYCEMVGVVRFELELHARWLQKNSLIYWGLSDYSLINTLFSQFLSVDKTLSVTAMDFETISECLINRGVVDTTLAANTTAMYAIQWMHGQSFDFDKSHIQKHRARLRKIGIDIAQRCNISKFSPVIVRHSREITVTDAVMPDWYIRPAAHLRVA